MDTLDAHVHFWRYDPARFDWIAHGSTLARDRTPADLRPLLDAAAIDACIAVQAQHDEAETDWLLGHAAERSWIAGVVGWTDLTALGLADRLARWEGTALVGLRHIVQDERDPCWLLRSDVLAGVRTLLSRGLAYDLLVRAPQLSHVAAFVDEVGEGAVVLDHAGKPGIARGDWQPWADTLRDIALRPTVTCKVSGLVTEADYDRWSPGEIMRYLDHVLDCFGPDRLMFGSDWPVCTLAAGHARVVALVEQFVQRACPTHRAAIFGETARRTYRIAEEER
jgi:predicted TIM-barrel fold metal-dependent hydrolase